MLKIKDDVDLKELEKFGFFYYEEDVTQDTDKEPFIIRSYDLYNDLPSMNRHKISGTIKENAKRYNTLAYIDVKDRIIHDDYEGNWTDFDLIYDLIQAGLVEKVEDS